MGPLHDQREYTRPSSPLVKSPRRIHDLDQPNFRNAKYTHGYGIVLSRVDKVTESGQPDMLIKNIPPESAVDEITVERPEIYFGELTYKYVITNTDEQEFDYPSGDTNVYTTYEGEAGIPLNMFNRIPPSGR